MANNPRAKASGRSGSPAAIARWVLGGVVTLTLLIVAINIALSLILFGPSDGAGRLVSDWRRIWLAHDVSTDKITADQAFQSLYGPSLGAAPRAQDVRGWLSSGLEGQEPIVWDVILARYLTERFGAVDGRTLPAGVYVAAGPIGPDGWPSPLLTNLFFPRHGYVLVVPVPDGQRSRPALAATASLRRDFRPGGNGDDLFAVVQVYGPDAFDFPTAGEPIHDLFLLSDDPRDIVVVERRIRAAAKRLDEAELGYGLFSRNSNSALRCFLKVSGLPSEKVDAIRHRPLARLRLPGIAQPLWKVGRRGAIPECSEQ